MQIISILPKCLLSSVIQDFKTIGKLNDKNCQIKRTKVLSHGKKMFALGTNGSCFPAVSGGVGLISGWVFSRS